jgi:hypothetical protein
LRASRKKSFRSSLRALNPYYCIASISTSVIGAHAKDAFRYSLSGSYSHKRRVIRRRLEAKARKTCWKGGAETDCSPGIDHPTRDTWKKKLNELIGMSTPFIWRKALYWRHQYLKATSATLPSDDLKISLFALPASTSTNPT